MVMDKQQLAIDVPIDHSKNDSYAPALADYMKGHETNTFLCYCTTTKKYFVSRWFKKENIENWYNKTIKIIQ